MPPPPDLEATLARAARARVPVASVALRAVAAKAALRFAGDDLCWYDRTALGRPLHVIDGVLTEYSGGRCLDEAERVLQRLSARMPIDILALELTDPAPNDPKLDGFAERLDGRYLACEHRYAREALLPLGADWETFLHHLGHDTRRNVRRYRRRAMDLGLRFTFAAAPPPESGRALRHALGEATHPAPFPARKIDRLDDFVRGREAAFHAVLAAGNGEPAGFVAGFLAGDTAYVVYQLNHRAQAANSLSLTVRAYLAEALIGRGVRALVFPNGCLGGLRIFCAPQPLSIVTFVRRGAVARAKAAMLMRRSPAHPASEAIRLARGAGG